MFDLFTKKRGNLKDDILSGLTVALALVPEAIAFAFVAGVPPLVGLYAAFFMGLITAIWGGRPGMISGATGAIAVVLVAVVAEEMKSLMASDWNYFLPPLFSRELFKLSLVFWVWDG